MQADRSVLITGIAGFIGFHLARYCAKLGYEVSGVDSLVDNAAPDLAKRRISVLENEIDVNFVAGDLSKSGVASGLMSTASPDLVLHMAASTRVRFVASDVVYKDNVIAFDKVLHAAAAENVKHFLFASTSSVYGPGSPRPFTENMVSTVPDNLYGASKLSNESLAGFCALANQMPVTAIRFFNVYGPWGRPDMAPFLFTELLSNKETITLNNQGKSVRQWTYVDDAVRGALTLAEHIPAASESYFQAVNLAGPEAVTTRELLDKLSAMLKTKATIENREIAEPHSNVAERSKLQELVGWNPATDIDQGLQNFLEWHESTWRTPPPS